MPAHRCPGNRRWMQLVFDAMLLMPIEPDDAPGPRRRAGRGPHAVRRSEPEGALARVRTAVAWARTPRARTRRRDTTPTRRRTSSPFGSTSTTVTFKVANDDGDDPSMPGSTSGTTRPASRRSPTPTRRRRGRNLDDTAEFAPASTSSSRTRPATGTFASARRSPVEPHAQEQEPGRSRSSCPTNWASATSGATATTTERGPRQSSRLIDDTESTSGPRTRTTSRPRRRSPGGDLSVDGKQATVDLAGTEAVRVRYVQVSAHIVGRTAAGSRPVRAVRALGVQQRATKVGNCSTDAGFTKVYTSPTTPSPAIRRGPWHRT